MESGSSVPSVMVTPLERPSLRIFFEEDVLEDSLGKLLEAIKDHHGEDDDDDNDKDRPRPDDDGGKSTSAEQTPVCGWEGGWKQFFLSTP